VTVDRAIAKRVAFHDKALSTVHLIPSPTHNAVGAVCAKTEVRAVQIIEAELELSASVILQNPWQKAGSRYRRRDLLLEEGSLQHA